MKKMLIAAVCLMLLSPAHAGASLFGSDGPKDTDEITPLQYEMCIRDSTPHVKGRRKENKKKQMLPLRNIICYIRRRPAITTQENIAPVQHDPEKNGMRPLLTYGIGPPKEAVQILPL